MKTIHLAWDVLRTAFNSFIRDRCIKLSAALAYFTIFSLPPMLLILFTLSSYLYGSEAIRGDLFGLIQGFIGADIALEIEDVLANITLEGRTGWATAFGVSMLLIGSTGIFSEMQDSINLIFGLKAQPHKNWIRLIVNRLISFSMILVLGFVLLVSLTINTLLEILLERLKATAPEFLFKTFYYMDYAVVVGVISLLFLLIFKMLPDAKVKWRHVLPGALVSSALFMAGKFLISAFLTDTYIVNAYRAAGTLIVLLIWVYYSSIILYFGAEINKAWMHVKNIEIRPNRFARYIGPAADGDRPATWHYQR